MKGNVDDGNERIGSSFSVGRGITSSTIIIVMVIVTTTTTVIITKTTVKDTRVERQERWPMRITQGESRNI